MIVRTKTKNNLVSSLCFQMQLAPLRRVSRICRVLKQPGAHMLNVGVGGSGRQSLSRLASFMMGMECFQIAISKSYTLVEWKEVGLSLPGVRLVTWTILGRGQHHGNMGNLQTTARITVVPPSHILAVPHQLNRVFTAK
jgi:hypothetical protein